MEVEPSVLAVSEILEGIEPADRRWLERARERTAGLLMPTRALGRLHDIAERLCAIGNTLQPEIARKGVLVMAGDHGVVAEGVSAYPQEITGEMVRAFLAGGAGINVLSRQVGAEVRVVDLGIIPDLDPQQMEGGKGLWVRKVGHGTGNLARGAAMSRDQAARAILAGFDSASRFFRDGVQILGTGDMGIGNTTPSAAIGCVLTGASPEDMVGRGTGVDDAGLGRKRDAVARGIAQNRPDPTDALGVLATVGGFEIGGITGCVLAGAFHGRPVVIDGFNLNGRRLDCPCPVPGGVRLSVCRPLLRGKGASAYAFPSGSGTDPGPGHAAGRGYRCRVGHGDHGRGGPDFKGDDDLRGCCDSRTVNARG